MSRGRRLLVIWLIGVMLLDMLIGAWAGIAVIEGVLAALAVLLPDRRTPAVRAPAVRNLPGTCVVFSDGTVCLHWYTLSGSHAIWPSLADVMKIHGHPEYGTRIEWLDQ